MGHSFLELRKNVVPEFVFGVGARGLVGQYARNLAFRKALVVTDPGIIQAGWTDEIIASLEAAGIAHVLYQEVSPNPRSAETMTGAIRFMETGCNGIVAVGGGSPMDCAKGIGIVSSNNRHIIQFEGVDEVPIPGPPLICIPTTAGSSADVSQFAIISDETRHTKMAIVSKTVVPDAALIDPEVTTTMDAYLTACTGIDALVHAIEAYVSNASSPITDLGALEAIRLISANLIDVLAAPHSLELRGRLMLGSLYAGIAFSNASLGAVHAMAHSLGGLLDVAHGQANAMLLEHVMAYNYEADPERYKTIGVAMGLDFSGKTEREANAMLLGKVSTLRRCAGIEQTLRDLKLRREDIPALAERAMLDACLVTNPRQPTQHEIEELYARAF